MLWQGNFLPVKNNRQSIYSDGKTSLFFRHFLFLSSKFDDLVPSVTFEVCRHINYGVSIISRRRTLYFLP
jgi:hypothetical protein